MSSDGKTKLQRDILLTWHRYPNATNTEIAKKCDCSPSYVSQVKNRFDDYHELDAMMDRQDRELERMFGEGIFASQGSVASQQGGMLSLAETWDELPDNPVGYVTKGIVLLILLYVFYHIFIALLF